MNPMLTPAMPFEAETTRCRVAQQQWSRLSVPERLRPVQALRHWLAENAKTLSLSVTQDIGRPAEEVLATDILPVADACRFLERRAASLLKPRHILGADRPLWLIGSRDQVIRRARGVVGIIGTWNYPIFLNAVPILQALTAGNGVLWKPSELIPATALALHEAFLLAGFPSDLFIRLPAERDVGPQLAEANIDNVVFTGSAGIGRKLAARLGERLIPSTLELSGCDATIVLSDADLLMAARAAWFAMTLNKGQTCMAVRRVFVQRNLYPQFLDHLRLLAKDARPEPLALASQADQAERLIRQALDGGARLLVDGPLPVAETDPPRFLPTIVTNANPKMDICREASFAPIQAVIPFDDLAEVIAAQSVCPYGLAASVFSRNVAAAQALARELPVGSVTVNDVIVPTAHPATPFGGCRASGWGSTQGAEGLLELTTPQVVTVRKGRFRPHYEGTGPGSPAAGILQGMLRWKHARRWRERWSGFWEMLRAAMKKKA